MVKLNIKNAINYKKNISNSEKTTNMLKDNNVMNDDNKIINDDNKNMNDDKENTIILNKPDCIISSNKHCHNIIKSNNLNMNRIKARRSYKI